MSQLGAIARRRLTRSGLEVSALGLGGAPLGNHLQEISEADAQATIEASWQAGIRYFDTAPHYGLGLAERRLGDAIRQLQLPGDEIVISTKVGRILEPVADDGRLDDEGFVVPRTYARRWDFTAAGVRRSVDESCARMGLDAVDMAFLHDPDDRMDQAIREGYPALASLRSEGRVAAIGAGMNSAPLLTRLVLECDLDVVLIAGRYSLLDQSALDELLPAALARGTDVVAGGVFNSGLLAQSSPSPAGTYDYVPAPPAMVDRARQLAAVCTSFGVTLPQAAVQFPLGHPAVVAIALGARSADEIRSDVGLLLEPIPPEFWSRLREIGLIRPDAPLPAAGVFDSRR